MSQPADSTVLLRLIRAVFELAAEHASTALTLWLDQPIRLSIHSVDAVELDEAVGLLGPEDAPVVASAMDLPGLLGGELLLVFDDRDGLALCDLVLGRPVGTSREWGELEQSAAQETANIVGCAFLNALGSHLNEGPGALPLVPSPPDFRREFAGSLLSFALMDQAMTSDRMMLVRSRFSGQAGELAWWLLFVPRAVAVPELERRLGPGSAAPDEAGGGARP
jgi:chemotaxis protein CheC